MARHDRRGRRSRDRGQTLVEFALVIPIFLTIVCSIADFSFLLAGRMGVTYTSQDGAQEVAQVGPTAKFKADCQLLALVERDIATPMDPKRIVSVEVFWAGHSGAVNTYERRGSLTCADGSTRPYTNTGYGYPEIERCNVLATSGGCSKTHTDVDWIGVTITYQHYWLTPVGATIGGTSGPKFIETTTTRMEPAL